MVKQRHHRLLLALCSIIVFQQQEPAAAQIAVTEEEVPAFESALEAAQTVLDSELDEPTLAFEQLSEGSADPGTELINGTVVDRRFFQAVLRAREPVTCTASLIGPATALLAAHCLSPDPAHVKRSVARVRFLFDGDRVDAICEAAPGYEVGNSEDWALCLFQRFLIGTFEGVNVSTLPTINKPIMLTGYGCTQQNEAPNPNRPLKAGFTEVIALPRGDSFIRTKSEGDQEAILCQGDSGGPAFVLLGSTVSDSRMIVGVNSQTKIAAGAGFLSATASGAGSDFIRDWVARNNQTVCGLNAGSNMRCKWNPS